MQKYFLYIMFLTGYRHYSRSRGRGITFIRIGIFTICLQVCSALSFGQKGFFLTNKSVLDNYHRAYESSAVHDYVLKRLLEEAQASLKQNSLTVVTKKQVPPSGDKHDYMSLSPYYWPDSTKPEGSPYIKKDGRINPGRYEISDRTALLRVGNAIKTLSIAYYVTREKKFAEKAQELLKVWFIDEKTRMNPHLSFSQIIVGENHGTPSGLIEGLILIYVADSVRMLDDLSSIGSKDKEVLMKWFSQYYSWLKSSPQGEKQFKMKNNHGTYYDLQILYYSIIFEDRNFIDKIVKSLKNRIREQFELDGRQKHETARTLGITYSIYNLRGWFMVANLLEMRGINLWNYESNNGAGLKKALNWIIPYIFEEKNWPYKQISGKKEEGAYFLLTKAADKYKDKSYTLRKKELDVNKVDLGDFFM